MTKPPAADEPAANAAAEPAAEPVDARPTAPGAGDATTQDLPPTPEPAPDAPVPSGTADEPRYEADYVAGDNPAPAAEWPAADDTPPPPPPGTTPPGAVPPGATPPPFGGGPFGNPPPFAAAPGFNRAMLVRPLQGRYIAGVCAAVGRATNTDPTLWRVIFAVLSLAGGVGIVAYLLGWILLPAEGDTGSPLEALLGRGRSGTSAPLAIVIGVAAVLTFLLVMSQNVGAALVGIAVVVGVVALVVRGQGGPAGGPHPAPAGPFAPPPPPPGPPPGPFAPTSGPKPFGPMSFGSPSFGSGPTAPAPTVPPAAPGPAAAAPTPPGPPPTRVFPATGEPLVAPNPAGYRAPFAPRGPYVGSPYAASLGYPPNIPVPPYPGLTTAPKPPRPPKERSKLGRLTFSLIVLALGVLAALEVTVVDFKASTFFAVPLAITALGLIVGAWLGRARVLILLGALLSIALAISTAASGVHVPRDTQNLHISPTTVAELGTRYSTDAGNIDADLSQLDLAGQDPPPPVQFRAGFGNIDITVPPNADVTVDVHIQGGDCKVFGNDCGGFNQTATYTDLGEDGAGGGTLHLNVDMRYGNVRVDR
ncbi:PspC domain-containing protein [Dactylosporangium sp. CA-092794]|uniref:PspC domain-containing protein n=1 Tax=Dactylosporangium sp. CA-092794 TaxID=3239929 RepID=UPI003D902794